MEWTDIGSLSANKWLLSGWMSFGKFDSKRIPSGDD